jgi:hypothetical protein
MSVILFLAVIESTAPSLGHWYMQEATFICLPSYAAAIAADPQSKATPLGAVVKFAAGGKQRGKKDLAMLAMETYGQDVYVASVCLEANYAQVMKAFAEAEAHKGVSLIVAYAPCVMQVRLGVECSRAASSSANVRRVIANQCYCSDWR